MKIFSSRRNGFLEIVIFSLILGGISLTRLYSYILFHSIAESISIVIATVIFIIAWTMRKEIDNSFFLVLGISSLFVAVLDNIHTLAYPGMNIIAGADTNLASQFWIATRYLQALSILGSIWAINKKKRPKLLVGLYFLITLTVIILILSGFFPNTFIEGSGLTPFKIISEYIIILIISVVFILFYYVRREFEKNMYYYINAFLAAFIISELSFTFYTSAYGLPNLIGHIFKIIAFYFLYKSIIQISLRNPLQVLFRKLNVSRNNFKDAYNRADFLMHLIAHDINNILQVIQLEVGKCKRSIKSSDNVKSFEKDLHVIENQINDGSKLVSNIVNLLKLEKEDIGLKKREVNHMLENKVAQIRERYQNRELDIQIKSSEEHIYVCANELLKQMFENVLSNAIKHNKDVPLEILIRITRKSLENERYIKMEFIDNGKGITDERKELLSDEDLTFKKSGEGMGLGLSLVKKIIDQFNGKMWMKDRTKGDHTKGSNFIVLLPEVEKR